MAGLSRVADTRRPRTAWQIFVEGGLERLTTSLRKGDIFSEEGLRELEGFQRRCRAFDEVLTQRIQWEKERARDGLE